VEHNHTDANTCVTCPIIRPDSEPRRPHQPPVCDGDRRLIHRWLGDIANLIADLSNPEPPIFDQRRHERFGIVYFEGGIRHIFSKGLKPSDPVSVLGGVAPVNSRSRQPAVTGSRERPIPINVAALDLKASAKVINTTGASWPEDQTGHLSAATVLDEWVRNIRAHLYPDHHLPPATVDELVLWLRTSTGDERTRIDDACDHYDQVADFAAAVKHLRGALRSAAGQSEPRPEPCIGVACPRCDLRALMTCPEDDYRAQCASCGTLLTEEEYASTVASQGENEKCARSPEEITLLMRQN
jgi:hypothetical protein